MGTEHVRITSAGGVGGTVEVAGVDVSRCVARAELDVSAAGPTLLTLHMFTGPVDVDAAEARVRLDKATRDALVALGWTPPPPPEGE